MSPPLEVHIGDDVEVVLLSDPREFSSGTVYHIFPDSSPDRITVILQNGDKGIVTSVIDSDNMIEHKIMSENHYNENKETCLGVMLKEEIPQTVQSFLNAEGGNLHIGVKDSGTREERLIGLSRDFNRIPDHENMDEGKLCDELERKIMDSLDKYLVSDSNLASLVEIDFPSVGDVKIARIKIKKSPKPWFFQNLTSKNKPTKFELFFQQTKFEDRTLDSFYIRFGGSKKLLSTHQDFYKYAQERFNA